MQYRVGKSTDIHQLVLGRKLIIGGVEIPSSIGLLGHSDADVLLHAIAEAILGALGKEDLGTYFPDNSTATLNMDSKVILQEVYEMMVNENYIINNLDCLIIIESIKMRPYISSMKNVIASILHTDIKNISIKATCMEKMGFVGENKGAIAEAIVMLKKDE